MNEQQREEVQLALLKIETVQNRLNELRGILLSLARGAIDSGKILPIKFVGQNTVRTDDDFSKNDCGPAALAMWLNWLGHSVSVDDVSAATGLTRGYKNTNPANLITAAQKWDLKLERIVGLTLDSIKAEIDRGAPVLVLVHYPSLAVRYDASYKSGHWLLVTGYDESHICYNDPYWPDIRGESIHLASALFEQAMHDCIVDGNLPHQGLKAI